MGSDEKLACLVRASRALTVTDVALLHDLGVDSARLTTIGLESRNCHRASFGPTSARA